APRHRIRYGRARRYAEGRARNVRARIHSRRVEPLRRTNRRGRAAARHPAHEPVQKDADAAHQERRTGMMRAPRAAIAALCLLTAARAGAQIVEPNTTSARVRIGPLALNPTFELLNLGIDTNVFNEPGDQKKRDFTFTVSPRTDAWLQIGRTWLTGN